MSAWRLWSPAELTVQPQEEAAAPPPVPEVEVPTAWQQGYEAGRQEGEAHARLAASRLAEIAHSLQGTLLQWDQALGEILLDLSIHLARQIVRHDLRAPQAALRASIEQALTLISQQPLVISLHPEDVLLLQQEMQDVLAAWPHRLEADATLDRGGCRITYADGVLDSTLQTRWERLLSALGRTAPRAQSAGEIASP